MGNGLPISISNEDNYLVEDGVILISYNKAGSKSTLFSVSNAALVILCLIFAFNIKMPINRQRFSLELRYFGHKNVPLSDSIVLVCQNEE